MELNFNEYLEGLRGLNIRIRRQLELAEAVVSNVNFLQTQLVAVGLVCEGIVIEGQVVHTEQYASAQGHYDSALLYQALLITPLGVGAVAWDAEEFVARQQSPDDGEKAQTATIKFVPFAHCSSAVKAILLPQVKVLLDELLHSHCSLYRKDT